MPGFDIFAVPLTYWLLFATIVALWLPQRTPIMWWSLFGATVVVAVAQQYVTDVGLGIIAVLGVATFLLGQQWRQTPFGARWKAAWGKWYIPSIALVHIVFLAVAGALAAHALPGFESYRVIGGVALHENADNVTIRFNFDKALIGIFFLLFCVERIKGIGEWWRVVKKVVPIIVGSVLPAFVIAYAFGYVEYDPIWTSYILAFALANLLITSVAEEVFFRGWMQAGLLQILKQKRHGHYWAIGITALVFGVAHLWGGFGLFLGAFLAGLGYGYAYYVTGRIEAAILAHFAFNGIHFTFFTYPVLLQAL